MPSTGRPAGDARPQRLVVAALAQAGHRGARRADAGQDGEIGSRDVVDELGAEPVERERDRAHVAGAVLADRDLHSRPFVDGSPSPSRATATRSARPTALNAASATWCASRPDASTWIDARAACARLESMCAGEPRVGLERQLGVRPPAEIDGGRASASSIGTTASP